MKTLALAALAALGSALLLACSAHDRAEASVPVADTSPEAERALSIARACVMKEPWGGQSQGYGVDVTRAIAQRDGSGSRFRVRVPETFYLGRLPPPRPAEALWITVDLASGACAPAAAP
jgi:hypothetical protein